ncbi:MAG: hypothetical protein ACRC67_29570 [Inquilinus sp.]|uniref:hypothetical protein n=1 Tax=Inquilinus sp. TaxID=1932117 RepID=UPI003F3FA96D
MIRRLARDLGLSRRALAAALDPDGMTADGPAGRPAEADPSPAAAPPDSHGRRFPFGRYEPIPAADLGLPEGHTYLLNTDTGEVFQAETAEVVKRLPVGDRPPDPAGTGPPSATAPPAPDPQPPLDPGEAEFQRQADHARQYGITLIMPPALRDRLDMRRHEQAGGGFESRSAADKTP